MVKTIFEESFITCCVDDSIPVLAHQWKSNTSSESFRATLLRMVAIYKEMKLQYPNLTWMGDTTNLGALSLDTQGWLKEKWTPILLESGVRHHALIVPKDVFAKFAMTKFKDNMENNHKQEMRMGHFPDHSMALEWLRRCLAKETGLVLAK